MLQYLLVDISSSNTKHTKFSRGGGVLLRRSLKHFKVSDTGYKVYLSIGKWP